VLRFNTSISFTTRASSLSYQRNARMHVILFAKRYDYIYNICLIRIMQQFDYLRKKRMLKKNTNHIKTENRLLVTTAL
jgi:hypothetical protein